MRFIKLLSILFAFAAIALIYRQFNPVESNLFPKCPFLVTTGLKCPGCGSQRAIHHLLHLNISSAFAENAILVISIPYITLGAIIDLIKHPSQKIANCRKTLYGQQAIILVLITIISFWIHRNILQF